jgi:lipopolysaccharide exporter
VTASLTKRATIGAMWMIAVRVASRTLGLVSTLIIARILVPADFGLVAMAAAFSQSVNAFSEVGVAEALVRLPDEATALYDTAFTMQAIRSQPRLDVLMVIRKFVRHPATSDL